jgi:uncharacterized protein YndB with AHSA1/START domain
MLIQAWICAGLLSWVVGLVAEQPQQADRAIRIELVVSGAPSEVYKLWTTEAGLRSWFAPDARVDARVGGRYEIIFDPATDPDGSVRGTKGARILELVPERKLVFEWIAFVSQEHPGYGGPPYMQEPERSLKKTRVEVTFELSPSDANKMRITLVHNGFSEGPKWDEALAYFRDKGWPGILRRLTNYCNQGTLPPWSRQ